MNAPSFPAQVAAVVFRRAPAFQPGPGEATTFPGRVRALRRRRVLTPNVLRGALIIRPTTFNEARAIGEAFRQGRFVLADLRQLPADEARRLVDFATGLVFGIGGSVERPDEEGVFLLRPPDRAGRVAAEAAHEGADLADTTEPEPVPEIALMLWIHPSEEIRETVRNIWNTPSLSADAKVKLLERYAAALADGEDATARRRA
jgi:Cell division protein SepF